MSLTPFWNKAIPAELRITEIEEGSVHYTARIDIQRLYFDSYLKTYQQVCPSSADRNSFLLAK
jgi:hypothetical protein